MTVVIMCATKLWSMEPGKGAPSFFNTVKGYVDAGWDTYLINPDTKEDIAKNSLEGLNHTEIKLYPNEQPKNKIGKWLHNNKVQKYYNKLLEEKVENVLQNIDRSNCILYAYEVGAVPVAKKMSKKYNLKLITRFQGTILYNKKHNIINRVGYRHHYNALKTLSDLVIMTNDGTFGEKVLKDLGNTSEIKFWRNGVNKPKELLELNNQNSTDKKTIELLTVSRLAKWKRVDRAIIALKTIVEKHPNCKLNIVGDGEDKERLMNLTKELNLINNVNFIGSVPQSVVYDYMKRADVFLSLYDLGNVGNPLYEAMMCGKPIVTINNGDTASVITNEENAIMLELDEIDTCGSKVIELLDNPEKAKRLGDSAKAYADKNFWTWPERIAEEVRVVEELLKGV